MGRKRELTRILIMTKDMTYAGYLEQTLKTFGYTDVVLEDDILGFSNFEKRKPTILILDSAVIDDIKDFTSMWTRYDKRVSHWGVLFIMSSKMKEAYSLRGDVAIFTETIAKVNDSALEQTSEVKQALEKKLKTAQASLKELGSKELEIAEASVKELEAKLFELEAKQSLVNEHLTKVRQTVRFLDRKIHDTTLFAKPLGALAIGAGIVYFGIRFSILWIATLGILTLVGSLIFFLFFLQGMNYEG